MALSIGTRYHPEEIIEMQKGDRRYDQREYDFGELDAMKLSRKYLTLHTPRDGIGDPLPRMVGYLIADWSGDGTMRFERSSTGDSVYVSDEERDREELRGDEWVLEPPAEDTGDVVEVRVRSEEEREEIRAKKDAREAKQEDPDHPDQVRLSDAFDASTVEDSDTGNVTVTIGDPDYDCCPPGKFNIQSCECCGCPSCERKSIYHRASKTPDYRCRNPNCETEFNHPVSIS